MVLIITFILLILFPCNLEATIITIPLNFTTIQEGIDYSQDGDTVLVLAGEYHENAYFRGKNILLTSEQGPGETFLRRVKFNWGTDTTAILRGFRISTNYNLPGIEIEGNNSAVIEGNIIHNCAWGHISYGGGGISAGTTHSKIRNNIIRDNWDLEKGGGIGILGSGFEISGNIIEGNIAGGDDESWGGGGIYAHGHSFVIKYNLIANNQGGIAPWPAPGAGALIEVRCDRGNAWVINNTFVKNIVLNSNINSGAGFLMYIVEGDDTCYVYNNIIAYNEGGGVRCWGFTYYFDYNLTWENLGGDYYGDVVPGPHSLFEDPLFVDLWGEDYHLQANSPCIDAGDPESPLDPDSTRADIGCYYYDQTTDITETDKPSGPHKFYLKQNYPNPFNGQTIISYYLDEEAYVELNIINMRGELVAKPVDSHQSSGDHSLIWPGTRTDGTPVSTGIYFYELKVSSPSSEPTRDIKAMILLK